MSKRVRLTNDTLNSYGYRVLTSGVDVSQYERNPLLLYMHERGKVIGYMKDIRVEDGEITGEPCFDEATELSKQCKKQWDFGSLRMVSIGFDVLETSGDPKYLLEGQKRPTVTKSRIYEVSVVDIGANDDAIVLRKDGTQITLGDGSDCPLPLLSNNPINNQPQMELKQIALTLGLPETADEAAVNAKLAELKSSKDEVEKMRKENDDLKLAQITAAVDAAVEAKKITADQKDHFVNLGKKVGIEDLNTTLAAMTPAVKLSGTLSTDPAPASTPVKGPWETRMDEIRATLRKQ